MEYIPNGQSRSWDDVHGSLSTERPHFMHLRAVNDSHFDLTHSPHHSPSTTPVMHRHTFVNKSEVNLEDLLENLKKSESLQDQADMIHYLYTRLSVAL